VLWRAIELKEEDLIEACITHGADLTLGLGADNESSIAHHALEIGLSEVVLRILRTPSGALLPDKVDTFGRTVLWRALELGHKEVVQACLMCGANASAIDEIAGTGRSLLHVALETGQADLVPDLLEAGAAAGVPDQNGRTPLAVAAQEKDEATVDVLLSAGAQPGPTGGGEALAAVEAGSFVLAERLIRASDRSRVPEALKAAGGKPGKRGSTAARKSLKPAAHRVMAVQALAGGGGSGGATATRTSGSVTPSSDGGHSLPDLEPATLPSILPKAVEAKAAGVVTAWLEVALEGAGLSPRDAMSMSESLTSWAVVNGMEFGQLQARAAALEKLPVTIITEGLKSASSDLSARGVPDGIVESLTAMQLNAHQPQDGPPGSPSKRKSSASPGPGLGAVGTPGSRTPSLSGIAEAAGLLKEQEEDEGATGTPASEEPSASESAEALGERPDTAERPGTRERIPDTIAEDESAPDGKAAADEENKAAEDSDASEEFPELQVNG